MREKGFTLIEIVMVLVLLGILSAYIAPKVTDVLSGAEAKAAQTAVMEAQTRINAKYSRLLYAGFSCPKAVKVVEDLQLVGDGAAGEWVNMGAWQITSGGKKISTDGTSVSVRLGTEGRTHTDAGKLFVPVCPSFDWEDDDLEESGKK